MALTVSNQLTNQLFNSIFGNFKNFGLFRRSFFQAGSSLSLDSFSSDATNQVIQATVKKMQAAISRSSINVSSGSTTAARNTAANEIVAPEPSKSEIAEGVKKAGGMEALGKWLIDGKTKIDVNGRKVVAQVGAAASSDNKPETVSQAREQAITSLQRFGLDESYLNKSVDRIREDLDRAAAAATQNSPELAYAVEYALEDAYAKLNAWDSMANGKVDANQAYEQQRAANKEQAESIVGQLGLGSGEVWGIESMGEDLAVFGMDFTAMSENPYDLAETIRTKSREMLDSLDSRYVGTETEYIKERNRITGASARLINGLEGAAAVGMATFSLTGEFASVRTNVTVGGTKLDASSIVAVGNVIVDPLVLDLNGDGIDLSAAEEGVMFDMNGDGKQTGTGFIRGDDAFLFLDERDDGIVHDGRQLFGNDGGYANGFEKLRQYDDNGDGVIDENDAIYEKLMVWQEKTEDGVCEREETMTLREAGIKSIDLGYQNVREDDGKGNLIGQTGSFTRDDGSEGYAADVWLREGKIDQQV